jgi:hypothetical protein
MLLKNLVELTEESMDGLQDLQKDGSIAQKSDTRKTRLTIEQINKLRQLSDLKVIEYHKKVEQVRRQFATQSSE